MGRKIIGATVGTTLNPKKIEEILGLTPNKDGNVTLADGRVIYFGKTIPEDAPAGSILIDLSKQESNGGIAEETDPTVPAWAKKPQPPTLSQLVNDAGFVTATDLPSGGGGFGLPLLYEATTTEEVQWIDTGKVFLAKNMLVIELTSIATATNEKDADGGCSAHPMEGLITPFTNRALANGVGALMAKQYDKYYKLVAFRGNDGAWVSLDGICNRVNLGRNPAYMQMGRYDYRENITGICIGNNSALSTFVFGVGTTLKVWGC